ncbi:MAG: rhodanese-like domain-containing protein, partial [Quisquiliibacterium sp.]
RSARALGLLRKAGHEQVFNLAGGIDAWRQAGLPVVK